jgi:hypothetical protein
MSTRRVRFIGIAIAGLVALTLAACSTTRLSQTGASSGGSTSSGSSTSGGICAPGQIPIPNGPPEALARSGATGTNATAGDAFVPLSGDWTVTDGSQSCGCGVQLNETQINVAGTAFSSGCKSSWLQQAVSFQLRNGGQSVAFSNGAGNVLYELQRSGPNLMVGFAFGQRITIFR